MDDDPRQRREEPIDVEFEPALRRGGLGAPVAVGLLGLVAAFAIGGYLLWKDRLPSLTPTAPDTEFIEQAAPTGPRLALVIGVGKYAGAVPALPNPPRDADIIASSLERVGFRVITLKDPTRAQLLTTLARFSGDLSGAGGNATGLIYFAGHGVQVNGVNYLLPRDAGLPDGIDTNLPTAMLERLLGESYIPAQDLLTALGERAEGVNILILDACRDNPLSRSLSQRTRAIGVTRGLAEMRAPTGVLIAYATGPGDVSYDGGGQNSPYAAALATEMLRSGQATDVFSRVRSRVRTATTGKQVPLELYRLERPFCFSGGCPGDAPPETTPAVVAPPPTVAPAPAPASSATTTPVVVPPPAAPSDQLLEQARVFGRAHYLVLVCEGRSTQTNRNYMQTLLARFTDTNIRKALIDRFNGSYRAEEADTPTCTDATREVLRNLQITATRYDTANASLVPTTTP